jgi:hypothetical protein
VDSKSSQCRSSPLAGTIISPAEFRRFPETNAEACGRVLQKILGATLVILVIQRTLTLRYVCCLTMKANAIFVQLTKVPYFCCTYYSLVLIGLNLLLKGVEKGTSKRVGAGYESGA